MELEHFESLVAIKVRKPKKSVPHLTIFVMQLSVLE